MIRTQIQLTEEQSEILKRMAHARRTSVAALIRASVDQFIQSRNGVEISWEERKRRAIAIAGKFEYEGDLNLSEDHDRYLAEAYADYEQRPIK